jgi:hypothetical protein
MFCCMVIGVPSFLRVGAITRADIIPGSDRPSWSILALFAASVAIPHSEGVGAKEGGGLLVSVGHVPVVAL